MEIKTWVERCNDHPDHQSGMVSEGMIRARMEEEIEDLRDEVERLRAENERLRTGLHRVLLASRSNMSSKYECGLIARETLDYKP